jgi:GalNAc-alpha-(1->4)-GalNAc-alpha-(1->3)-diNAcBac-PP-undecaprenol alpha-1,4-N-acetyl-D-galactosaminyltransferase
MKRTLILAYSRQAGGAEKSAIKLFNAFSHTEGIDPFFGTLVRSKKDFYEVDDSSKTVNFFPISNVFIAKQVPFRWLWLPLVTPFDLLHFRATIKLNKIDSVVSFGAGVGCVAFLGLIGSRVKQVTSERIDPNPQIYKPSILARLLRPFIYRHGVICSVQTIGFSDWVYRNWGVRAIVTPNHFEIPLDQYLNLTNDGPVVAVGRPAFQKGYDLLFNAWKHFEDSDSRELWVVCDDSEGFIDSLIRQSGCRNIRVQPLTDDLHSVFNRASLFISTARFEGYPNAVAEAIIYGIPTMTTVSSDIVGDWADGRLCVPILDTDPKILSEQILQVVHNHSLLNEISNNAVSNRKIFSWEHAKSSWISAINSKH